MQDLYYIENSASLTLIRKNGNYQEWSDVDNLLVDSSSYQIVAISGSVELATFPINGTNIYYTNAPILSGPPIQSQSIQNSGLTTYFSITDVIDANTGSCTYSISSSIFSISGSGYSTEIGLGLTPDYTYKIRLTGGGTYTSHMWIYDTTDGPVEVYFPGVLLTEVSKSNAGVTASLYVSTSRTYAAYLQINGNEA